MDIQEHMSNRNQFPPEELEKYAGRYVAWSPDGTQIVAAADRLSALAPAIEASEFDPAECVLSYVPHADEVILGGAPGK